MFAAAATVLIGWLVVSTAAPIPVPARINDESVRFGGPVVLDSQPEGAIVELDGEQLGVTPLRLDTLPAGRHGLALNANDYEGWSGDLLVIPGFPVTQRITLSPMPGYLSLNAALEGARWWADGREAGQLPMETQLPAGERSIRVEADGYKPWEGQVALRPNEHRSLFVVGNGGELAISYGDPAGGVAVMIDNYDDARPQIGLDHADVVYEAMAEGGITRFMALFLTGDAGTVGPIRSARHYFVQWANEYSTPLVHIGGSPQAYSALGTTRLPTLDGRAFWRNPRRPAPHNAFIGTAEARAEVRPRQQPSFGGLRFRADARAPGGASAAGVRLVYYPPFTYTVEWQYDPATGRYLRSMAGAPHLDGETREQLSAVNVLVLWMDAWPIPDDEAGRMDFRLTGSGRLLALTDGGVIEGEWRRSSLSRATDLRDKSGQPLLLSPGPTWIQVVPIHAAVDLL